MAHLIDKDALVSEIKKHQAVWEGMDGDYCKGQRLAYSDVLSFLNTLEVKEVDLEKETKKWWKEHLHLNPENKLWMDAHQSVVFAKHFFELGMQQSKNDNNNGEKK